MIEVKCLSVARDIPAPALDCGLVAVVFPVNTR